MQQDTEAIDAQLRDKVWTYAQRAVVLLVFFLGGVLMGYRLWGQATQLQERVDELTERNQSLIKERDTERSKVALIERDKKELEKRLQEAKSAAAAAAAAAPQEPAPAAADQPS
jgi:ribosomal protein L12E/L44/L45/RPP1/RPP2